MDLRVNDINRQPHINRNDQLIDLLIIQNKPMEQTNIENRGFICPSPSTRMRTSQYSLNGFTRRARTIRSFLSSLHNLFINCCLLPIWLQAEKRQERIQNFFCFSFVIPSEGRSLAVRSTIGKFKRQRNDSSLFCFELL